MHLMSFQYFWMVEFMSMNGIFKFKILFRKSQIRRRKSTRIRGIFGGAKRSKKVKNRLQFIKCDAFIMFILQNGKCYRGYYTVLDVFCLGILCLMNFDIFCNKPFVTFDI